MDLLRFRDELIITRISNRSQNDSYKRSVSDVSERLDWSLDILPVLPRTNSEDHLQNVDKVYDLSKKSIQEDHVTSVEDDYNRADGVRRQAYEVERRTPSHEELDCTTDMLPAAFCEATVSRDENNRGDQPDTTGEELSLNLYPPELGRIKKFRCNECQYSTDVSSHFRAHKRRHTGERPYACPLCPYRAAESCTLNRHKLTHSGAKKHSCPFCPYRAFLAGDVAKHMRCHTGERPYSCPLCPYRASRRSSVKEHLATHATDKEYDCELCGHKSATRIQLRRHMKNKHYFSSLTLPIP